MQVGAGDAEAARGQRLVAVIFADGGDGEFDLVFVDLALKGAGGLVVGNVDNVVKLGGFYFLECSVSDLRRAPSCRAPG